jgi:hypothetical protein
VHIISIEKHGCVQTVLFPKYFYNLCCSPKSFTKLCHFSKKIHVLKRDGTWTFEREEREEKGHPCQLKNQKMVFDQNQW